MSSGKATLVELQTVLGVEDAQDILEVILVDNENAYRAREAKK